ncbi:MAG: hypothetical protein PUK40_02165 [Actinomycetaceae bacterium]|nr:hypothetical protein [Arcanobacterium sp.]MDD7504746.1 hypothetical protein [Actinomycetaceae bacterium]MDY6143583.1 hypothetical protein [Arcanobacterium sp.]
MDALTLATVPAILAVVNLGKQFGIKGKWSALLAVLLGVIFRFLDQWAAWGFTLDVNAAALTTEGLIIGLSAAGLYDVAGKITETSAETGGRHRIDS